MRNKTDIGKEYLQSLKEICQEDMSEGVDDKLKDIILHGSHEEFVKAFEKDVAKHPNPDYRLAIGSRVLTWEDMVEEIRAR